MISENIIKFDQMKRYFFDQDTSMKFLEYLTNKGKVFAPHTKGETSYSFEKVEDLKRVVFDYPRTILPLKKFFLPPQETLLNFNLADNSFSEHEVEKEKRIFFAVHAYEMQSILRLDYNFTKGNPESNYLNKRDNSCFIGHNCTDRHWIITWC